MTEPAHLTLQHRNDIHGRLQQRASSATLAGRTREEAARAGGYCALWDNGGAEDGALCESGATKGRAVMALLRVALEAFDSMGHLPIPQEQIQFEVPAIIPQLLEGSIGRHAALNAPGAKQITMQGAGDGSPAAP